MNALGCIYYLLVGLMTSLLVMIVNEKHGFNQLKMKVYDHFLQLFIEHVQSEYNIVTHKLTRGLKIIKYNIQRVPIT